jgi:SNF2 family DNA or RNA helicase
MNKNSAFIESLMNTTKLLPFQVETVKWMKKRTSDGYNGGFVYHEQGLGKTICIINYLVSTSKWKNSLIVCPSSLLEMWKDQIIQHTTLDSADIGVYHGADRNKIYNNKSSGKLYLTSYTIVSREYKQYTQNTGTFNYAVHFLNRKFTCISLDEAHYIRNRTSETTKGVCNFIKSDLWWIITATPIMNGLDDVFPHFRLLNIKGIETIHDFRSVVPKSNIGLASVNDIIKRHGIRYLKQDVLEQLASKNEYVMTLNFSPIELDFYNALFKYSQSRLEQLASRSKDLTSGDIDSLIKRLMSMSTLTLILRLKQCCDSPALILGSMKQLSGKTMKQAVETLQFYNQQKHIETECVVCLDKIGDHIINPCGHKLCGSCNEKLVQYNFKQCPICRSKFKTIHPIDSEIVCDKTFDLDLFEESSKVKKILELVKETISQGEKIVIVSQWVTMLELLSATIKDSLGEKSLILSGKHNIKARHESVRVFQTNPKYKIMLVSLNSSAEGITLTAAKRLVHVDIWWNKGKESQVTDRIHRIGQTGTAEIIHLRIANSIEQLVAKIVDKKSKISENALSKEHVDRIKTKDDGWIREIVTLVSKTHIV